MKATVDIGKGEFTFCGAHTGLHAGGYEPLHGHTFILSLKLYGTVDAAGMVTDFGPVKAALRTAIAPLRRRTLVATLAEDPPVTATGGRIRFGDPAKYYDLPAADVALLPLTNTTTEAIAGYLADQIALALSDVEEVELTLSEAPDVSVTVRRSTGARS